MSMKSMLQEHMAAAQGLLQRVDALCGTQPRSMEGRGRLCRRLKAELRFLRRVETGKVLIKESHLQSTNLAHLTAIVQSAESLADVVSVLHEFSYLDRGGTKRCLVVDVVANGGHAWVKAIGRKAEALHDVWQGRGKYGDRSIVSWAEDFLEASGQLPVQCSRPSIIFAFYNGVSRPMADTLRSMGVNMRGDIVAVNAEEQEEEVGTELEVIHSKEEGDSEGDDEEDDEEDDDDDEAAGLTRVDRHTVVECLAFPDLKVEECCRVNLDISTLITYVSSLSHGRCHFSFREQALTEQAAMERREEVLPKLDSFMKDKELFACQSAVRDFRVILDTLGGPGEKERATALLARVRVVPDQPSERTHTVTAAASSKVNHRSLMIFGTGDALRAVTMTANVGFVKAAANQGVQYGVFIHQPRSLTEGKEWRATPI